MLTLKNPQHDRIFVIEYDLVGAEYYSFNKLFDKRDVVIHKYYFDPYKKLHIDRGESYGILGVGDDDVVHYLYICKKEIYLRKIRSEVYNILNPKRKEEWQA